MRTPTIEKTAGTYYLQNVNETASGFQLVADGTFRFFFTYGALDRYGSGKWTLENGNAILQSRPWVGRDFEFVSSGTVNDDAVSVKIVESNPQLISHAFISLRNGETGSWTQTNQQGVARFPGQAVASISLVFEFAPERFTRYLPDDPSQNSFAFKFEPWMMEVYFDKFPLKVERYALAGKHPLLRGERYVYEKG